jgi:hypothetical protein
MDPELIIFIIPGILFIALLVCIWVLLKNGEPKRKTNFNGRGMSCCPACNQLYYGSFCDKC